MEGENKMKKTLLIVVIILLVLAIVLVIVWSSMQKERVEQTNEVVNNNIETSTSNTVDHFRDEVPVDVKVPELGEDLDGEEADVIAVPKTVSSAAPGVSAKFRRFEIVANNNIFTPSTIIVNERDSVHIGFIAQDKEYDITFPSYSMKQTAKAGEKKVLEFQANHTGDFLYYCDMCGGENSSAVGHIIVVPKKDE